MRNIEIPSDAKCLIVGSDLVARACKDEEDARFTIACIVSDKVYEDLGGDEEFLYGEDGELLPDEEIIDKVDDILALGEEHGICYQTEKGLWAYASDETPHANIEYTIYSISTGI